MIQDIQDTFIRTAISQVNRGCYAAALSVLWCCGIAQAQAPSPAVAALHTFTGHDGDGSDPQGGLVLDKRGVLYGTTFLGGGGCAPIGCGTIFELKPPSAPGEGWTENVLYSFMGQPDGQGPSANLTIGKDGQLYGIADGGPNGYGTVFQLTPPRSAGTPWNETLLYSFMGGNDGAFPQGNLALGPNNRIYGTTNSGGSAVFYGAVYELTPPASAGVPWVETVLYSFQGGDDGWAPEAGLVAGAGGALYGTTTYGGSGSCTTGTCGTVFELTPPAATGGVWKENILYTFRGGSDGAYPQSALVIGADGTLYGTTSSGGAWNSGTVFRLSPPASPEGAWTEAVIHSFKAASAGGPVIPTGVVIGEDRALYGAAMEGGLYTSCPLGCGSIFKLTPPTSAGMAWTDTVLYRFTGAADGAYPTMAPLAIGPHNKLFGTTSFGGNANDCYNGCGVVFEWKP